MSLSIRVLGGLTISSNDQEIKLPNSKRARALLAYLAVTDRPHRRERLCEIFWEMADDPRGALRWVLSRIRPIVNDESSERLVADRERVSLVTTDIETDIKALALALTSKDTTFSVKELESYLLQLQETFLAGLDLPDQDIFQSWLTAERNEVTSLEGQTLRHLSSHSDVPLPKRLSWARYWEKLEPFNPLAASQLLLLLKLQDKTSEISTLAAEFTKRFRNAGIEWSAEHALKTNRLNKKHDKSEAVNIGEVLAEHSLNNTSHRPILAEQKIHFCKAFDDVNIAYASVGEGRPIIKAANWLSHLEYDWDAPIWSPLFRNLARDHHFIRYDERGCGLSDWDVDDLSFSAFVTDLEAVVDANKLDKFALLGISQGAAVSIEYAIRYPNRVTHLILFGGYASGWRIDADKATIKEREAIITLTEAGWGQDNPAYRQIFSSTFMPSASTEELAWFNEFQRLTTSPKNAARFLSEFGYIDVREHLSKISVPTLVIHSRNDARIPFETGREIAASIPNAEFLSLESDGHLLLGREPSSQVFVEKIREFIARI